MMTAPYRLRGLHPTPAKEVFLDRGQPEGEVFRAATATGETIMGSAFIRPELYLNFSLM